MLKYIIQKIQQIPYSIFFIDGVGAFLSFCFLYFIIEPFRSFFGINGEIALMLAVFALMLGTISIAFFKFKPKRKKMFLLVVIVANVLYCIVTLAILIQFLNDITIWGFLYFLLELMILGVLIYVELQVYAIEKSN